MSDSAARPPVVTILGHVDHGKTSLLDRIRHASVASGEVGGITQAIGAYQIVHNGKTITFIDTPGHAAFSAMRRRGGLAADIAILLVAADDSVMPQTKESIEHIKSAGIPFVVAVNKIDLPGVNPERVKSSLAECGVYVEGYGGNVPIVPISAKTGVGIDDLLEVILLLAELEELKDNRDVKPATALVIESSLHSQKGPLATLLVKQGTFEKNAALFDGPTNIGKVRSMTNSFGKSIDSAPPSTPFQVIGFSTVPRVGDIITDSAQKANTQVVSGLANTEAIEKPNIILKADVQGSLEAIIEAIKDKVNLSFATVGSVNESDIQSAVALHAEIVGFNSKLPTNVAKLAEVEKIKFTNFKIIYQLFDYLDEISKKKLSEQAPKPVVEGEAKVIKAFNFSGTIVYGCLCTSGKFKMGSLVKGAKITSLKTNKADLDEIKKDQEFGMVTDPALELKVGDIIQSYILVKA